MNIQKKSWHAPPSKTSGKWRLVGSICKYESLLVTFIYRVEAPQKYKYSAFHNKDSHVKCLTFLDRHEQWMNESLVTIHYTGCLMTETLWYDPLIIPIQQGNYNIISLNNNHNHNLIFSPFFTSNLSHGSFPKGSTCHQTLVSWEIHRLRVDDHGSEGWKGGWG